MDRKALSNVITLPYIPDEEARKDNLLYCHVCLKKKKLTEEHIPPEKAFNEHDKLWEKLVFDDKPIRARRINIKGGFWVKTLCSDCNNNIGSPYAKEYVKFVKDLVSSPQLFDSKGSACLFNINSDTLLIAKEVAIMILASEPISFARGKTELREF